MIDASTVWEFGENIKGAFPHIACLRNEWDERESWVERNDVDGPAASSGRELVLGTLGSIWTSKLVFHRDWPRWKRIPYSDEIHSEECFED